MGLFTIEEAQQALESDEAKTIDDVIKALVAFKPEYFETDVESDMDDSVLQFLSEYMQSHSMYMMFVLRKLKITRMAWQQSLLSVNVECIPVSQIDQTHSWCMYYDAEEADLVILGYMAAIYKINGTDVEVVDVKAEHK